MKYYYNQNIRKIKALFSHTHKGFTLVETLITVAVLAILIAVSIPGVVSVQKNLKMKELDDIARQIFLLSQSQLTEIKSNGRLDAFGNELKPLANEQNLGLLNKRPDDYVKTTVSGKDDLKWKDFYFINDTDDVLKKYIIKEVSALSAYLEGGSFIVELSPVTGDIYGAFYSPKPNLSYTEDVLKLDNRGRDARVKPQIGYYGGEAGSSASSAAPEAFLPELQVVNGEDLYIKFECSNLQALLRTQSSFKLTISAKDEHSGTWEKDVTVPRIDATGYMSEYILLDSLRTNENFEKLTDSKLQAGDNITVTATLNYSNKEVNIAGVVEQTFNSLFASKITDELGQTQIAVSALRHLNNLRSATYAAVPETNIIEITQRNSIDFLYGTENNWADDIGGNPAIMPGERQENPLTWFNAISNSKLLVREGNKKTIYNGNGNSLLNFPLAPSTDSPSKDVGLFSSAKNMTFKNMRMVDFSVNGAKDENDEYKPVDYENVGILVGTLTDGNVIDVRAHLSTRDENGRFYGTEMPDRLARYSINIGGGKSNVGGLIGTATGHTAITSSFAAVPINAIGSRNVGGLVGSFAIGTIANSYGSGNIAASSYAGGLCGVVTGVATISDCYSTSNVTANSYAGGLVGATTAASTFRNGRSYGVVVKHDKGIDVNTSGPFVGHQTSPNTYENCQYLRQGTYNSSYNGPSSGYGAGKLHKELVASTANGKDNSYPYIYELEGKTFPFPMAKVAENVLVPHYGDWVEATTMQTSLVYYEKYDDGEYGYYAKTSLSTVGGTDEGDNGLWVVDTLHDEPCIEDGYALMTIFPLSRFECTLEPNIAPATVQKIITTDDADGAGKDKAPLIQSDVTVEFKKDDLAQSIENARVYQLPFNLQIAERKGTGADGSVIKNFYLKLKVDGYVGKTENEKKVIDDFNFYYCPDFAKNAINPEIGSTDTNHPKDPTDVFVRSPRQLNGLSRYNYYWNASNNGGKPFTFKQETELDYTNYVTTYCGVVYDLMDTSEENPYRNRPIGRPSHFKGQGQFMNVYDGNYKKIIDYRCEVYPNDNYQFVGLFGEVYQSTLKNIILTASKPGKEDEASSAYIKSHFNDKSYKSGTGALAGLVYVSIDDTYNEKTAVISNCAVNGYDVITTDTLEYTSAVGGLVGYNFGHIEKSSANSKTVVADSKTGAQRYLGGLAGSINGKGTITDCYAGGMLKSTATDVKVGGIVAGFDNIYGGGYQDASYRNQRVDTSYSHCTWKKGNLKGGEFYPCINVEDHIRAANCYYLTDSVDSLLGIVADEERGKTTEELKTMALHPNASELPNFGIASATYPWTNTAKDYPFPAIVKDMSGRLVHYGDWYANNIIVPKAIFTYYEKYGDGSYGFQFAQTSGIPELTGNLKGNMIKDKEAVEIIEADYGVLVLESSELPSVWVNKTELTLALVAPSHIIGNNTYQLHTITNLPTNTGKGKNVTLLYEERGQTDKVTQELYVNFDFAATVSLEERTPNAKAPIQVRTEKQLRNLSKGVQGEFYKMTHSIAIINFGGTDTGNLQNDGYTFDGGYVAGDGGLHYAYSKLDRWAGSKGNYIFGLRAPLFKDNAGTVQNVALLGASSDGAALALKNSNTIANCFAQGDITGVDGNAAGLVLTNSGTIKGCYFSGAVRAMLLNSSAGLVHTNSATIINCYTVGEVDGVSSAAGFVNVNSGSISYSYSAMNVTSKGEKYGFANGNSNKIKNCYWLRDNNNNNITDNKNGTAMTLKNFGNTGENGLLSKINIDGNMNVWHISGNTVPAYPFNSSLNGKQYPYPKILQLEQYGDWPVVS